MNYFPLSNLFKKMSMYLLSKWLVVINSEIIRKLEVNESETYNIKPNIKDNGKTSIWAVKMWKEYGNKTTC